MERDRYEKLPKVLKDQLGMILDIITEDINILRDCPLDLVLRIKQSIKQSNSQTVLYKDQFERIICSLILLDDIDILSIVDNPLILNRLQCYHPKVDRNIISLTKLASVNRNRIVLYGIDRKQSKFVIKWNPKIQLHIDNYQKMK